MRIPKYFKVSNVKGDNIDILRQFILNLDPVYKWDILKYEKQVCIIEDVFFVNGGKPERIVKAVQNREFKGTMFRGKRNA